MSKRFKELIKIFAAIFVFISLFTVVYYINNKPDTQTVQEKEDSLSGFFNKIKTDKIRKATINDESIRYTDIQNKQYIVNIPYNIQKKVILALSRKNVAMTYLPGNIQNNTKEKKTKFRTFSIFDTIWDIVFLIIFLVLLKSGMGGGGARNNIIGGTGQKNDPKKSEVTFKDVAGIDAYKNEVLEIVDFLKHSEKYNKYGAIIPKGVLLCGEPGTGKTLIARAMAGEANVPFFPVSGSDFVEIFVGVGAARVRDLFKAAAKHPAAIIFIDEIDTLGRKRSEMTHNSELLNTLNALLVAMDGFSKNNIVVIGATNRPEVLDEALLRPGRFDRIVSIPLPDLKGREEIVNVVMKKVKIPYMFTSKQVAIITPFFSGADLHNLINETILIALKNQKSILTLKDLEKARDKVMSGVPDGKKHDLKQLIATAYHEVGHAFIAHVYKKLYPPIYKLTIASHGNTLGFLLSLPENDTELTSKERYIAQIKVALGGRAAEEVFFGADKVSSGAYSDFKKATKIANTMVRKFGMSSNGMLIMDEDEYYLVSDKMKEQLYDEAKNLVNNCYKEVLEILNKNKDMIHRITYYLLAYETLYREDIENIINGNFLLVNNPATINFINNTILATEDHKILI